MKGLLGRKDIYMNTAIMTIGDEILIGQIIDTNSAWMAKELNARGFDLKEIVTVSDEKTQILAALDRLIKSYSIVLITGGLGPTKDDITKTTLAEYYNCEMVENPEILEHLKKYYASRNRALSDTAYQMSLVPEACEVFINQKGTAASMWFERENKVVVSMPGVPYEMKDMMTRVVLPKLEASYDTNFIYHRTILTAGLPESKIADLIAKEESDLPNGVSLAYLPSMGKVRVRVSGRGKAEVERHVNDTAESIKKIIAPCVFGEGEQELAEVIAELITNRNLKLGLAESCTGGFISHLITSIPGSSRFYNGSVIAYSNEMKSDLLAVEPNTIIAKGAVSEETVIEMARGAIDSLKADITLAISGIAGPGGGTPDKPVGTVWLAVAQKAAKETVVKTKLLNLTQSREINIPLASNLALNFLRKCILG